VKKVNQQKSERQPTVAETESDLLSRFLFEEGDVYLSGGNYSEMDLAGQTGAWAGHHLGKEATA
jgi:hypothetical protein